MATSTALCSIVNPTLPEILNILAKKGIHAELFPHLDEAGAIGLCQSYDEADLARHYRELIAAESRLTVNTGSAVVSVTRIGDRIVETTCADGRMQPATPTFRIEGVDFSAFGLDTRGPRWRSRWLVIYAG